MAMARREPGRHGDEYAAKGLQDHLAAIRDAAHLQRGAVAKDHSCDREITLLDRAAHAP